MHRTAILLLLAAPLGGPLTAGCGGSSSGSRGATTAAPVTSTAPLAFRTLDQGTWTGVVSSPPDASSQEVVTDATGWARLWAAHAGAAPRPSVDLASEQVIALFLGERPTGGYTIEVTAVAETSGGYEVTYERTAPQGAGAPGATRPFHLVALNRSGGAITFRDATPSPTSRPLQDFHGGLVTAAATAGGQALAFLPDGATDALEVEDPTALVAAGLHEGHTLVVTGDALANLGGRTALAEAARVASFAVDDLVAGGRLEPGFPGVAFQDASGAAYVPDGPLAAALLAQPLDRPLLVTGRVDPTRPATQVGPYLLVTSWRATTSLAWESIRPLVGSTSFAVDDLAGAGAYRTAAFEALGPTTRTSRGSGRALDAALLTDLRARVAAAALATQPSVFQPGQIYPDHPTETLRYADDKGEVTITVYAGAQVPQEVQDLLSALGRLPSAVPTFRALAQGDTSQIVTPGAEVCRDAQAWGDLWARHVGGRPAVPALDFVREVGVGVFDGQRPSTGYAVEVTDVVRIGPCLDVVVRHTTPTRAVATPTAPFCFAAVDLAGFQGDLWVDGRRAP
jgi:hypothetical protein